MCSCFVGVEIFFLSSLHTFSYSDNHGLVVIVPPTLSQKRSPVRGQNMRKVFGCADLHAGSVCGTLFDGGLNGCNSFTAIHLHGPPEHGQN